MLLVNSVPPCEHKGFVRDANGKLICWLDLSPALSLQLAGELYVPVRKYGTGKLTVHVRELSRMGVVRNPSCP